MYPRTPLALVLAPILAPILVLGAAPPRPEPPMTPSPTLQALLSPWQGPYGGVPPWDQVRPADFAAAFSAGMDAQRRRVEAIASDPAAPTFENTLAALERSSAVLDRVRILADVHFGTLKVGDVPRIEAELSPKLAAFADEITQNARLFKRVEAVYEARDKAGLTPEQKRLTWLTYTQFVRSGARLTGEQKARIQVINQELATLNTRFAQNVLEEEARLFTVIDREADLDGLSPDFRASAARAADAQGFSALQISPGSACQKPTTSLAR